MQVKCNWTISGEDIPGTASVRYMLNSGWYHTIAAVKAGI